MSEVNPIRNSLITWTPTLVQNMDRHDNVNWEMASWSNGDPFANTWQTDNITFNNGIMTITLDNQGCPQTCDGKPYASGEYRTQSENYGYGYYEVRMKPAQGSGLMAGSFFTYRGVYGQSSHDEIDIEFLGKDPNCQTLQLNYYVEGRGNHEKVVHLPFNACQEFHNYGFMWTNEALIWYVDGQEVHRVVENFNTPEHEIPYRPGKIMVNLWPGTSSVEGWLGRFSYPNRPIQAQYDWIKYSTLEAAQAPTPGPTPPQVRQSSFAEPLPLLSFIPNPELGRTYLDGRAELWGVELVDRLTLVQLEETLEALVSNPYLPLSGNEDRFKVFDEIRKIDQNYAYKLFPFFLDPRSYWDNAVTLLAAYVQKCSEEFKEDKMEKALEFLTKIRQYISQIASPQITDPHRYIPSSYKMALLDLVEAEITSLIKKQDVGFYQLGIENALAALATFLNPPQEKYYPSQPDYFGTVKTILILGDLYQKLALLTYENKYFEAAQQLYQSIASLSETGNLGLDLYRLFADPQLADLAPVDLRIYNPTCEPGLPSTTLMVSAEEINQALNFNQAQGYIREKDVEIAQSGIFHYLRGIALIKEALLFVSQPYQVKTPSEIMGAFEKINQGIAEIKIDEEKNQKSSERNEFFYQLARLGKGELLLALSSHIVLQGLASEDVERAKSIPEISSVISPQVGGPLEPKAELTFQLGKELIELAEKKYFIDIPEKFPYLLAWEVVKKIEIAVRLGKYVKHLNQGSILDAKEGLSLIEQYKEPLRILGEGEQTKEYLAIEFDYLKIILFLAGEARNYFWDYKNKTYPKIFYPEKALLLIQKMEKDVSSLPETLRIYFKTYLILQEATTMIQFFQLGKLNDEQKHLMNQRIKEKTGQEMSPLDYARLLLKDLENSIAPIFPSFLWYNFKVTLGKLLKKERLSSQQINHVKLIVKIVGEYVQERDPNLYEKIKENLSDLSKNVEKQDLAKARSIFDHLLKELSSQNQTSDRFWSYYGNILTWDMHSLFAELYYNLASVYTLSHGNKNMKVQYTQSAYLESMQSTAEYDRTSRPYFLFRLTEDKPAEKNDTCPSCYDPPPELMQASRIIGR